MYLEKPSSPNCNLSDEQYIFCVSDQYKIKEEERLAQRRLNVKNQVYMIEPGWYGYENPVCPHCGSKKIVKNYFNPKVIYNNENKKETVYLQRYICKECDKSFQTHLNKSKEENRFIPFFINNSIHKMASWYKIPLRKISNIIKLFTDIDISYETVRRYLIENDDLDYVNENIKLSGYYSYDAQWIPVDSKYVPKNLRTYEMKRKNRCYIYRMAIFDLVNNEPVAERMTFTESNKEIKQFFDDVLEYKDRKAIVTDSKHDYDVLMRKMKFKHQKCTFHLKMNMNKTIKEYLIKLERKFKAQYPNKSKKEINKSVKKEKKEISEWMKWFWKIFKHKTFKEAQKQVEELRLSLPDAPEIIKKIISQKFLPEYRSYLLFLEDAHLDKLKPTNNNIENYFGNTLPKGQKSQYRTPQGVASQIHHRIQNWNVN